MSASSARLGWSTGLATLSMAAPVGAQATLPPPVQQYVSVNAPVVVLVVLRGDLTRDPSAIRNTVTVVRLGIGYDSAKLLRSVKGLVGLR